MCSHERLLDYLYDELPATERLAFEGHLQECQTCRVELSALGGTRLALASWSPPEPELGFRIIRNEEPKPQPSRAWFHWSPAWGLAAAAVLVLAAAAAISNVEVRYGSDGVVVRTGWGREAPVPADAAAPTAAPVSVASEDWGARLQLLDQRLKQLESNRTVRAASVSDDTGTSAARTADAELIRQMRKIVADSEAKQQRELALRVAQMVRDFDAARVGDLARVEQGLRQIQGLTDAELIQHRNTLNHLLRVTQQR
jgi:hypothetical protein